MNAVTSKDGKNTPTVGGLEGGEGGLLRWLHRTKGGDEIGQRDRYMSSRV